MTPEIRRELGTKRSKVTHLIRYEMRMRGYSDSSFARELVGLSHQSVRKTLIGENHSPRVLDALREIGVPEKYLFDPRRMVVPGVTVKAETQERV